MTRALLALLLLLAAPATAQEPLVRMELGETEVIPGQPVSLRLTVLVPTFLPAPPVWPSFEAPNLLVRIGASGPTSEAIEGATWAGITRRYLITPMLPGPVALPSQQIVVTWADPDTSEPRRTVLAIDPLSVTGVVPEGAEGLDPFIAANALELAQTVEGETLGMVPGDGVIRTVTATIVGTSPMFLSALLPAHTIPGMRAYPDAPVVAETEDRGDLSGTRVERVTLVAEGGGAGAAPEVTIDWFNLTTGRVETTRVEAVALSVSGPPAASDPATRPRDWRAVMVSVVVGALGLVLAAALLRLALPRLRAWAGRRRDAWRASEAFAYRRLTRMVRARDQASLYRALDTWAARVRGPDPRRDAQVAAALTALGAARYGPTPGNEARGWRALAQALSQVRSAPRSCQSAARLPPLNPGT